MTSKSFKWSAATAAIVIVSYLVTWHLYAMWWFILVFVDFAVLLLWVIIAFNSIIFWIRNRKMVRHPYIILVVNLLPVIIIFLSPSIDRNKSYLRNTIELCKYQNINCSSNLHLKFYCVHGGGALGSDMNLVYLTDSINFRLFLGTYDEEDGMITTKVSGDAVIITKTEKTEQTFKLDTTITNGLIKTVPKLSYVLKTVSKKSYNLNDLKRQHVFE